MNIVYKTLKEIRPYEKNPRKNDNAIECVMNSIKEFGFKVPIVIDSNNIIVAGHTRYKAAQQLNMQEVPCIITDDLTDEQVKAFRLVDNKASELSGWDFNLLQEELDGIINIDLDKFGFFIEDNVGNLSVTDDDFLSDTEITKSKDKTIICPHCGCEIKV